MLANLLVVMVMVVVVVVVWDGGEARLGIAC